MGAVEGRESDVHIGNHALNDDVEIHFDQSDLNSKRTFIFARAGYGKSNLMKIICKEWKPDNGGLLVFDPEGEYAVTDKKGRPGIMDARGALLLTNQKMDDNLCNVHHDIKLDLRRIPHKMAIPLLVTPEKHEMVFFNKMMGMEEKIGSGLWTCCMNMAGIPPKVLSIVSCAGGIRKMKITLVNKTNPEVL